MRGKTNKTRPESQEVVINQTDFGSFVYETSGRHREGERHARHEMKTCMEYDMRIRT
jgi:hypothetical protein